MGESITLYHYFVVHRYIGIKNRIFGIRWTKSAAASAKEHEKGFAETEQQRIFIHYNKMRRTIAK